MENSVARDFQSRTFSVKLWPPSESTRTMLVDRITKNLSTESIFSRKYGLLTKEEAFENAKKIEEVCYASANEHFSQETDGDGSSAVQLYAKETSKLMLEVLKKGPKTVEQKPAKAGKIIFDISTGQRGFIEAAEAKEILNPLAELGNSYTKICFSNRSFGIDAANVAGPILVSIREQLKEVDLSDIVAGRPEDEALEVMRVFSSALEGCSLRYLNLSDNALGEKGVRAFGALLKSQESLEELYLMNDGISVDAARALVELIPTTDKLKILHFHNNMTGDDGALSIAELLQRSPLIENFRCSSTRIGSEGGIALVTALEVCTRLKKLDIRDNLFGVEAGISLSKTLGRLTGITELYLSDLNLEDEGAISIVGAIKKSVQHLEVLEMGGNEITAKGASAIADCLSVLQSLKKLGLSENELKDKGAVVIGKALEQGHPFLKELDLSSNGVGRVGARCLAHAVANKPHFELLNIDGNKISDDGIDEVKDVLKNGKAGEHVLGPLDENDVNGEDEGEEEHDDEEAEDDTGDLDDDLQSKMEHLKVEQD